MATNNDTFRINGCGLFYWASSLSDARKLEILNWYEGLTKEEKEMVQDLRQESYEDAVYNEREQE